MDTKPRKPYPSDLNDTEWALVEPLLPPPVSAGAPRKTDFREVLNAIFYVLRDRPAFKCNSRKNLGDTSDRLSECVQPFSREVKE